MTTISARIAAQLHLPGGQMLSAIEGATHVMRLATPHLQGTEPRGPCGWGA